MIFLKKISGGTVAAAAKLISISNSEMYLIAKFKWFGAIALSFERVEYCRAEGQLEPLLCSLFSIVLIVKLPVHNNL